MAKQLADSEYNQLFEETVKETGIQASTVAAFLTETLKALKREGIQIEKVNDEQAKNIFKAVGTGDLAKEAMANVFVGFQERRQNSSRCCCSFGFENVTETELVPIIDRIVAANTAN